MDSIILAKKEVLFHGVWKVGIGINDNLMRTIGSEVASKPSCLCTLRLTTSGLTLALPPSPDGKTRRTNQMSFDSLKDVSVNRYQPKCLTIIYINELGKLRIIACSSDTEKDILDISNAYKEQKNVRLINSMKDTNNQHSPNWTLRQNQNFPSNDHKNIVRESYLKSSTPIDSSPANQSVLNGRGFIRHQFGSFQRNSASYVSSIASNNLDNDDDVFADGKFVLVHEPGDVLRELAGWSTKEGHEIFCVQTQTPPHEEDFDTESITSAAALQIPQVGILSTSVEAKSAHEIGSAISSEAFHMRGRRQTDERHNESNRDHHGERNEQHFNKDKVQDEILTNGKDNDSGEKENDGSYDLRSFGTQTTLVSISGSRRYTKKQVSRQTSNSYKDKVETLRKRSSSSGPRSPTSEANSPPATPTVPPPSSRISVVSGSVRGSTSSQSSVMTQSVKRPLSITSTTVIKPIEDVYHVRSMRRSNSARGQRPIIIYSPTVINREF